ncbi:hypothetical protein AVEN_5221-1 [Araneus ventricosus]|uniref:Uncharacterized protein n=1 Tax=Araneus ventricosus TaxID=182803 RepID=A0A4Y2I222_ARAVE|nr:hypothetical protein AVEN_5221-1 [Araneus ventricosus]
MAPNVNLQRRKRQRDAKRDIDKLRKELLKKEKQQKKQQKKEQKKQQEMERKKQQNKELSASLAKERCKRYYENQKKKEMAAGASAAKLQLNGGASTSTGSFTMSSGLVWLIFEQFNIDKDVLIIVMGDLNVDVKRNEKAFGFMKKHYDLNMVPTNYPNALGNSYILIQHLQETLVTNY